MPKIINIALCIIIDKEQRSILLIRRQNTPYKNYWALPGGKIEFGELPLQAATRETLEETGLSAASANVLGCATETIASEKETEAHFIMFPVLVTPESGEPVHSEEGSLQWFNLKTLHKEENIIPTDIDIIHRFHHNQCSKIPHYSVIRNGKEYNLCSVTD